MATAQWIDAFFTPEDLSPRDKLLMGLHVVWALLIAAGAIAVWGVGFYALTSWALQAGGLI